MQRLDPLEATTRFSSPFHLLRLWLFWASSLRARTVDRWRDLSLALLLAGILGNLTDRLLYGHVIDFLLSICMSHTRIPCEREREREIVQAASPRRASQDGAGTFSTDYSRTRSRDHRSQKH